MLGALIGCAAPSPSARPASSSSAPSTPADAAAIAVRYLALGDSFTIGTGSAPLRAFPTRLAERWRTQGCSLEMKKVAVNG